MLKKKYNPFTDTFDYYNPEINTGGSSYIKGQAASYGALPAAADHTGEFWLVEAATGTYLVNRKPAGLYYSNGTIWKNAPDIIPFFSDAAFEIFDDANSDNSISFNLDSITGKRTVTIPDKDVSIIDPDNVIHVSKNGGHFKTLEAAMSSITDNSSAKRYTIVINDGRFVENNPIVLKDYVSIVGTSTSMNSVVEAQNPGELFSGGASGSTIIRNLTMINASDYVLDVDTPFHVLMEHVEIADSLAGVYLDGGSVQCSHIEVHGVVAMTDFATVESGKFKVDHMELGSGTSISNIFNISGSDSLCRLDNISATQCPGVEYVVRAGGGCRVAGSAHNILGVQNWVTLYGSGTEIRIDNSKIFNCTNTGVTIDGTGSVVFGTFGTTVIDSAVLEYNITNPDSLVFGGGHTNLSRSNIHKDARVYAQFLDMTKGDESYKILGELHVGAAERPSESCFGGGDSYSGVGAINIYSYDGTSYTDVTAELSYSDGITNSLANGAPGSGYYISTNAFLNNDYLKLPGFKYNLSNTTDNIADGTITASGGNSADIAGEYRYYGMFNGKYAYKTDSNSHYLFYLQGNWCVDSNTPGTANNYTDTMYYSRTVEGTFNPNTPNTGNPTSIFNNSLDNNPFTIQYWDGANSSWEDLMFMVRQGSRPHESYGTAIFENGGSYQVWLDALLAHELNWAKNDPVGLGEDRYWIRVIFKDPVTTPPVLDQIKVHSDRSEKNASGFDEFFGGARYYRILPWDVGLLEAASSSPSNQDLYLSSTLDRGYVENEFQNGATDRVGFNATMPPEMDTSTPIRIRWSCVSDDATAGNVNWFIRWGYSKDRDAIYRIINQAPTTHPTEQVINYVAEAPGDDLQKTYHVDLDVSKIRARRPDGSSDVLWVTIERQGGSASDTHSGDLAMITLQPLYSNTSLGGHI